MLIKLWCQYCSNIPWPLYQRNQILLEVWDSFGDIFAEILGMISKNPPFNCTLPSHFGLMTTPKQPNHHLDNRDCQKMGRLPKKVMFWRSFWSWKHVYSKQERPTLWAIGIRQHFMINNLLLYLAIWIKKGLHFFPLAPPFFSRFLLQQTTKSFVGWRMFCWVLNSSNSGWQVGSAPGSDLAMFTMKRCWGEPIRSDEGSVSHSTKMCLHIFWPKISISFSDWLV